MAHMRPAVFKDRYAAYLIKARRKLST